MPYITYAAILIERENVDGFAKIPESGFAVKN